MLNVLQLCYDLHYLLVGQFFLLSLLYNHNYTDLATLFSLLNILRQVYMPARRYFRCYFGTLTLLQIAGPSYTLTETDLANTCLATFAWYRYVVRKKLLNGAKPS